MLSVDSLQHSYTRERVLNGVYLTCMPGEVIGVVGRNGCGKTTMLRAMFGSLHATHLHLEIDGVHMRNAYRSGILRYLPQEPFLPRRLTVRSALRLVLPDAASRRDILYHPFVAPLLDRRVKALSGGEQRYLEVLLVTHLPSAYALLDEPFTEIEPAHRGPLCETIRNVAKTHNRGMILTDHAYREVLKTSDRVVVLVDGVIRDALGEDDLRKWGYTP